MGRSLLLARPCTPALALPPMKHLPTRPLPNWLRGHARLVGQAVLPLAAAAWLLALPAWVQGWEEDEALLDSTARMVGSVQLAQALPRHMGVDGGGGDVGMAQQQLHRTQVGAVVEQMRGEGVAQGVR